MSRELASPSPTCKPSAATPRRLTLVIHSLGGGGAERVLSTMAGWWAERGVEVTLITLAGTGGDFYPLAPQVRRIALDLSRPSRGAFDALRANLERVRTLRSALRTSCPDAILSFGDITNVMTLLAATGLRIPVLVSERVDPRRYSIGRFWTTLRRLTYPRAARLVVQTEALRPWAETHISPARVVVIPNPVWIREEGAASSCGPGVPPVIETSPGTGSSPEQHPFPAAPLPLTGRTPVPRTVIAMGRLDPQKGFDLLLRAFAWIAPEAPDWSLTILGEGAERPRLEALVDELDIRGRVTLPGRLPDPERHLRAADLFVLSSRFEGFPNALIEAMACALPVISTDCPTGPGEILRNGVDGLLVPPEDVEALAAALRRLITTPAERQLLASRAPEVTERFSLERVMEMWEKAIKAPPERA